MEHSSLLGGKPSSRRAPLGGYGPAVVIGLCVVAACALASVVVYGSPGDSDLGQEMALQPLLAASSQGQGYDCFAAFGALSPLVCSPSSPSLSSSPHGGLAAQDSKGGVAHTTALWPPKPVDCSCCQSNCKKVGVIHATVDGKRTTTRYWCKQPYPYGHTKCETVFDYACNCCDIVRDVYHGKQCA